MSSRITKTIVTVLGAIILAITFTGCSVPESQPIFHQTDSSEREMAQMQADRAKTAAKQDAEQVVYDKARAAEQANSETKRLAEEASRDVAHVSKKVVKKSGKAGKRTIKRIIRKVL